MARRRHKGEERELATARIARLLALAAQDPVYADRYAQLSAQLATKYQTGWSAQAKRLVCRDCHAYLGPAAVRVRVRGGRIVRTCLACGGMRRRPVGPNAGAVAGAAA